MGKQVGGRCFNTLCVLKNKFYPFYINNSYFYKNRYSQKTLADQINSLKSWNKDKIVSKYD